MVWLASFSRHDCQPSAASTSARITASARQSCHRLRINNLRTQNLKRDQRQQIKPG
jgi:hypothetical protein